MLSMLLVLCGCKWSRCEDWAACAHAGYRNGEVLASKKVDPNSKFKRSWQLDPCSTQPHSRQLVTLVLPLILNPNVNLDPGV